MSSAPKKNQTEESSGGIGVSRVREIVAGMFVGAILSLVTAITGFGIGTINSITSSLRSAGAGLSGEAASLGTTTIDLVIGTPLEVSGDLAVSTWIFAPIASAATFALVAAMVMGILVVTWRAIVVIT